MPFVDGIELAYPEDDTQERLLGSGSGEDDPEFVKRNDDTCLLTSLSVGRCGSGLGLGTIVFGSDMNALMETTKCLKDSTFR